MYLGYTDNKIVYNYYILSKFSRTYTHISKKKKNQNVRELPLSQYLLQYPSELVYILLFSMLYNTQVPETIYRNKHLRNRNTVLFCFVFLHE